MQIQNTTPITMYHDNVVKKIPGSIPPPPKRENQGYIEALSTKQIFELKELLDRQNNLLNNKRFVAKLPDKGEKIKKFRDKIISELNAKNDIERAANLLSRLNIASEGKAAMNELEWTGKYSENPRAEKIVELDSDDEEDPLKILAQPTGTGVHKKKVIILPPEESLIRPEDLEDSGNSDEHVKYIVDMVEKPKAEEKRGSFKPYQTTKTNVHDPRKELERKRDKHWEVTAATPPPSIHGTVKALTIQESLILQKEQAEKLQEIQTKNAIMRLAEHLGPQMGSKVAHIAGSFRSAVAEDSNSSGSEDENEEHEVLDDEDTDKGGTVVFTVETIET